MAKNKIILNKALDIGSCDPSKLKNLIAFIAKNNAAVSIAQQKFFACFGFSILNLNLNIKHINMGKKRNSKGQFISKDNGEINIRIPGLMKILKTILISAIILIIISPWIFVLTSRINIKEAFRKIMEYILIGEYNKDKKDKKEKSNGYF